MIGLTIYAAARQALRDQWRAVGEAWEAVVSRGHGRAAAGAGRRGILESASGLILKRSSRRRRLNVFEPSSRLGREQQQAWAVDIKVTPRTSSCCASWRAGVVDRAGGGQLPEVSGRDPAGKQQGGATSTAPELHGAVKRAATGVEAPGREDDLRRRPVGDLRSPEQGEARRTPWSWRASVEIAFNPAFVNDAAQAARPATACTH